MFYLLRRRKIRAVTYAEILVAVVMLAVCGLPIFGLLNFSNRGTREQSAEAEAGNLAKEEMNRLMYVADYEELLKNTLVDVPWGLAEGQELVTRKGHVFDGHYAIYPHDNSEIIFKVPKMNFHQPQGCTNGETHSDVVSSDEFENVNLKQLYPDVDTPLLIDIRLEIKWKLPADKEYPPQNVLILYGRRYHTVE